jgi:hypothetical protein
MGTFKRKQSGSRLSLLLIVLTLALICTTSAFAQDYLNYQLNGNNPPGSWVNPASGSVSGGQIYRGEGAGYSGYWVPQPASAGLTAVQQCVNAVNAAYAAAGSTNTVTAASFNSTSTKFTGGVLNCVPATTTSLPGMVVSVSNNPIVFAGDWSNFNSTFLATNSAGGAAAVPSEAYFGAVPTGAPAGNYVQTEQCMACHGHNNSTYGGNYLMTGHKNGIRKVVAGQPLHSSDGSTYTGITWNTTSQPTTSTGVPVYYTIAGWMSPGAAPDNETTSYTCAYCHAAGYNPSAATTAAGYLTSEDGIFNWATGTPQATYPGPEPTQVVPIATKIQGVAVPTSGNSAGNQITFTTSTSTGLGANALVLVNGLTSPLGARLNGTVFQLNASATGTTFTATSTIPNAYYAGYAQTGTETAGSISQLVPIPTSAMSRKGENGSADSSWYLTGITCERCHISGVGTNATGELIPHGQTSGPVDNQFNAGHEFAVVNGAIGTPVIPTGQNATALCMECHRLQIVSSGVQAISVVTPPVGSNATHGVVGSYSDGDYQGSEFLNSPHAEYIGTVTQNQQGTADTSINFNGTYYSSLFTGGSGAAAGTNSGCTGCHDPHQTIVGSEFTGTTLAKAPTAIQNANLLQPAGSKWGSLASFGTGGESPAPANNCNNCHGAAGPGTTITQVIHPAGTGTMMPNGGLAAGDNPGSCMVCHMAGATGQPKYHFFRINPSASYYTYNTSANYGATSAVSAYAVNGTNVTFTTATNLAAVGDEITITGSTAAFNNSYIVTSVGTDTFTASLTLLGSPASISGSGSIGGTATVSAAPFNTYNPSSNDGYSAANAFTAGNNAIGLDVDIACGQCHGGGTNGKNPYGMTLANTGAPTITRGELAKYAANIHGKVATPNAPAAPEFNTGTGQAGGTFAASQSPLTVTLTDVDSAATIYYCLGASCNPATGGTAYTTGISISGSQTINAVAQVTINGTLYSSPVSQESYSFTAGTPTISPAGGTYNAQQTVTLTGASFYCIEASQAVSAPCTPTTAYTAPLTISVNSAVRAVAGGGTTGLAQGTIADSAYTIQPAPPTITPSVPFYGSFTGTVTKGSNVITNPSVALSAGNVGMVVYGSGIPAGATIATITPTVTLSANATATATGPLTLSGSFTVTLTDATATGAAIYYTTDGSDPRTSSTKSTYSSAVTIPASATTTLKAAAVYSQKIGSTTYTAASSVTSAFFVVK